VVKVNLQGSRRGPRDKCGFQLEVSHVSLPSRPRPTICLDLPFASEPCQSVSGTLGQQPPLTSPSVGPWPKPECRAPSLLRC